MGCRYFDEEDEGAKLEYIPAPGSPTGAAILNDDSDDEEDPLDAYMAAIQHQVPLTLILYYYYWISEISLC
jgi:hypothetical protein